MYRDIGCEKCEKNFGGYFSRNVIIKFCFSTFKNPPWTPWKCSMDPLGSQGPPLGNTAVKVQKIINLKIQQFFTAFFHNMCQILAIFCFHILYTFFDSNSYWNNNQIILYGKKIVPPHVKMNVRNPLFSYNRS